MLNWIRGKVSRDLSRDASQYDSVSKDDAEGHSGGKNTLVVVRDGAVPKMTLESNELQLLQDIPQFKPLLSDTGTSQSQSHIDAKALLTICKTYQDHMHQSAETVNTEQALLTSKLKEVDLTVKVLMDRMSERQKAYAKAADQLHKTADITQSLKKIRYNIKETEEMFRQLNERLPESLQLKPFNFVEVKKPD